MTKFKNGEMAIYKGKTSSEMFGKKVRVESYTRKSSGRVRFSFERGPDHWVCFTGSDDVLEKIK